LNSAALYFYRWFLAPLLVAGFRVSAVFNAKIAAGLKMRQKTNGLSPWLSGSVGKNPVWIHCASGEFEYAKPVITDLKKAHPHARILVTYFSPSIANAVHRFPGVDFACPTPWENRRDWDEFIAHHRPQVLLIARTDTWPEMLWAAKRARIPTLLFSATFSPESGRAKGLGRWISRATFSLLDGIFCVSPSDLATFKGLGLKNDLVVTGDTRYDQVQARLKSPKPVRDELFDIQNKLPTLVAGSTWPEDEVELVKVAAQFKSRLRFVLVPHEPTVPHLTELERELETAGLKYQRYSSTPMWNDDAVLVVNKTGILAELYLKGTLAFVGGSFRKTVHSVMEPLAAGAITFVGPLHRNNREALEFANLPLSDSLSMVQPVMDAREFSAKLELALAELEAKGTQAIRALVIAEISTRSGKSANVIRWIESHAKTLDSSTHQN
jgi:3-deoxy-D-manno-octulosonic-acid transferase